MAGNGIELATAYISLIPTLRDATKNIERDLSKLDLSDAGRKLGKNLGSSMAKGLSDGGLESLQSAVKRAESQVEQAYFRVEQATGKVEVAQRRLAEAREKYGEGSSRYAQAELDLRNAENNVKRASDSLASAQAKLSEAQGDLEAEASGANEALRRQQAEMERVERSAKGIQDAGKSIASFGRGIDKLGDSISNMGDKLTMYVTAPIIAAGTAASKTAIDFESSMSRVSGALNDPAADMDALRQLALDLGAQTIFSASEAGAAMEELAYGGLTAAQIQGGALATSMDLAAAGNMQLAEAADSVVRVMGAFGLSAEDSSQAANALAGGAAASSAEVHDLTMALQQTAAQANNAGWSVQETVGVLSAFADAGIVGSDAGTSLKVMLQRLSAPTDKAAGKMEELGINTRDSNGQLLGAADMAEELTDKLGSLDNATRDAALQTIFGSDASRAALSLMNAGRSTIEDYVAATSDQTAANRLAETQMGDTARAIEEMRGAVETSAIEIGDALAPSIEDIAGKVQDAAQWFSELDDEQQRTLIKLAGGLALAGPAVKVFGTAMQGAGKLVNVAGKAVSGFGDAILDLATSPKTAETAIGKLAGTIAKFPGPVALAAAGIGVLVAGIVSLVDAATEADREARLEAQALDVLANSTNIYSGAAAPAAETTRALGDEISAMSESVQQNWQDIVDLGSAFDEINSKASAQVSQLLNARSAIELYAGQTDLSIEQQGKLRSAVEQVNDQLGTSYAVAKDAAGAYQVMSDGASVAKDDIYELIDAQIQQAKVSAQTEKLESLYKEQAEQAEDYAEALGLVKKAQEEYNKQVQILVDNGYNKDEAKDLARDGKSKLEEAREAASELEDQMNATGKAISANEAALGNLTNAASGTVEGFEALVQGSVGLNTFFSSTGEDMADFTADLEEAGGSVENFNGVTDTQLMEIAARWNGTSESIKEALDDLEIEIPDAAKVSMEGFYENLSDYGRHAVDKALEVSGMMLEHFRGKTDEYGLTGKYSIMAFAEEIANGTPEEEAAAKAQAVIEELEGRVDDAGVVGGETGGKYAGGIASQEGKVSLSSKLLGSTAVGGVSGTPSILGSIGTKAGSDYSSGLASTEESVRQSSDKLANATKSGVSSLPYYLNSTGYSSGTGLSTGISSTAGMVSQSASYVSGTATNAINGLPGAFNATGSNATSSMAGGISSGNGKVADASNKVASSAKGMTDVGDMFQSGNHLVQNFANGISSAWKAVKDAATGIADRVASILQFSVPEQGVWSGSEKGGYTSGRHLVENIARGMLAEVPAIESAARKVSEAQRSMDGSAYRGSYRPSAPAGGAGRGISQSFEIYANDPELVAAVVAARQYRAMQGAMQ